MGVGVGMANFFLDPSIRIDARDRNDRPLSLLACYIWGSGTPLRDLASRIRRALLDNSSGPQLPASQFRDSWYPNPDRLDVAILLLVGSHGAASPPTRLAVAPL